MLVVGVCNYKSDEDALERLEISSKSSLHSLDMEGRLMAYSPNYWWVVVEEVVTCGGRSFCFTGILE